MGNSLFRLKLLFWINLASSCAEFLLALFYANSVSVKADSLHAFAHSIWYFIGIMEYKMLQSHKLSHEEEQKLRQRFSYIYILIFFGSLAYVSIEAIWRLLHPQQIIPIYMVLGTCIGILGNIATFFILHAMNKAEQPHTHGKIRISQFILHVAVDFGISAAILIYAGALMIFPPSQELFSIDPVLTILVVLLASVIGFKKFFGSHAHPDQIHHHHH